MNMLTLRETVSPEMPAQLAPANLPPALPGAEIPELISLRFDPIAAFLTFRLQNSLCPDEFSLNNIVLPRQGCYPYCWYRRGNSIEAIVPREMVSWSCFDYAFHVEALAKWRREKSPECREDFRAYVQ
jgi:hypothetical protein